MPLNAAGKFSINPQMGKATESLPEKPKIEAPGAPAESGDVHEIHDHGDGTFHTVHKGQQEEHASIGHLHAHISKTHGAGEKHAHLHHDGFSAHSHTVDEQGQTQEQEHESGQEAGQHAGSFLDGEQQDAGAPGEQLGAQPAGDDTGLGV
jgi:hypothetical protein